MSKEQVNNTLKASVFEDLFSDPVRRLELYKALHPEDTEITIDEVNEITLKQLLLKGQYNDLGLLVRNKLIVLCEAQSTWTVNIIPRCIMYLGDTWLRYGSRNEFYWYSEKKVPLPETEMYVIYTGNKKINKKEISLSEEFYGGKKTAIDATVKVLTYDGGNDILDQYIMFCKIFDEQRELYPDDRVLAVKETIRICLEKGILVEYLTNRREEVENIMLAFFDQDAQTKMMIAEERRDAAEKAKIQTSIEMYQDFGKSFADVIKLIMNKFNLTESVSKGFVTQYWKA